MTEHNSSNCNIDSQNVSTSADMELRRQLSSLPQERTPSGDLWPGILRRIQQPSTPRRRTRKAHPWLWFGAAAAGLLILALLPMRHTQVVTSSVSSATADSDRPAANIASRALRVQAQAMTLEYRLALQQFDTARLPEALQGEAAELDRSATQIHDAMARDPNAPFLLRRLHRVYAQRLQLMRHVRLG